MNYLIFEQEIEGVYELVACFDIFEIKLNSETKDVNSWRHTLRKISDLARIYVRLFVLFRKFLIRSKEFLLHTSFEIS